MESSPSPTNPVSDLRKSKDKKTPLISAVTAENSKKFIKNETEKTRIIHEYNLKVIEDLTRQLKELEEEERKIEEEEAKLKVKGEEIREKMEEKEKELKSSEEHLGMLKEENDKLNHEYLRLRQMKEEQEEAQRNRSQGNNSGNNNRNNGAGFGSLTLGDVLEGLVRIRGVNGSFFGGGSVLNDSGENNITSTEDDDHPPSLQQVEKLPSFKYPRSSENEEKCEICGFEFCFNDEVTKLDRCGHSFHKQCLGNRLLAKGSSRCPTCKKFVFE